MPSVVPWELCMVMKCWKGHRNLPSSVAYLSVLPWCWCSPFCPWARMRILLHSWSPFRKGGFLRKWVQFLRPSITRLLCLREERTAAVLALNESWKMGKLSWRPPSTPTCLEELGQCYQSFPLQVIWGKEMFLLSMEMQVVFAAYSAAAHNKLNGLNWAGCRSHSL